MSYQPLKTNRGVTIYPDLPKDAERLWMELDNGTLILDSENRCQYLTSSDVKVDDGSHSEELPIVNANNKKVVGVVHLHWDGDRNLLYMHAKEHMLGPKKYDIPFDDGLWNDVVKKVIQ